MPAVARRVDELFGRHDRRWILYVAVVLTGMYLVGQLTEPFIGHDDFDWLIFRFDQAFESPWSKTLTEGRWLNFLWSYLSHYLSIRGAVLLHLAMFSLFVWTMPRLLIGRDSVVAALLLFGAPMAAETSLWPVTQVTGVLVSLVACWGMFAARAEPARLAWMAGGVFVGYLCYPSFGPVLLLLSAAYIVDARSLVRTGGVYVATFVTVVLFVFLLNLIFHDSFSIQPAGWRGATPLLKGGTLLGNIERYLKYYRQVIELWPMLIVSALAYAVCLWRGIRKFQCIAILVLGAMLLSMDAVLSVVSGLDLWLRASLWIWMVLSFPVIFLIGESRTRMLALALALPMLAFGALAWSNTFQNVRNVFPAVHALAEDVALAQARVAGQFDSVVVYGDVHDSQFLRYMMNNRALRNLLFKRYGWYTTPCTPEFCDSIEAELASRQSPPEWIVLDRKFVIILSNNRGDLY